MWERALCHCLEEVLVFSESLSSVLVNYTIVPKDTQRHSVIAVALLVTLVPRLLPVFQHGEEPGYEATLSLVGRVL